MTFVYGYRPPPLRVEPGSRTYGSLLKLQRRIERQRRAPASTSRQVVAQCSQVRPRLLVYKAIALEGGVLFPVVSEDDQSRERMRVAVNFAYFFWLK